MNAAWTTYQLWIWLEQPAEIAVGRLGVCTFPAGWYVYTGSARRHFAARLRRHCRDASDKRMRWHIDYFLAIAEARILFISPSRKSECALNAESGGQVICRGLGASDCRAGCGSHLRFLGAEGSLPEIVRAPRIVAEA